jgi:hypothetical protein
MPCRALQASGSFAEFDHPKSVGQDRWLTDVITIGTMPNAPSKAHVPGYCSDLAALVTGRGEPATTRVQNHSQTRRSWR